MPNTRGDRLLLTVARLNRWATRHAHLPAPAAQLRLLTLVSDLGPARIGDLAKADNSSQPTMTTQVQRLEAMGLVLRTIDSSDARATLVTITRKGQGYIAKAREARAEVVVPLLDGLSEDELAIVDQAITILDRGLAAQREKSGKS